MHVLGPAGYASQVHPLTCHEDTQGDYRYSSTLSLTSALEWGRWSTQSPHHFTPRKRIWMSLGDSSVGIGTRYGLHGPGIVSCWGLNFPHPSRRNLDPPSLLYKEVPDLFPGGCGFRIIVAFSAVSLIEINPLEERPTTIIILQFPPME